MSITADKITKIVFFIFLSIRTCDDLTNFLQPLFQLFVSPVRAHFPAHFARSRHPHEGGEGGDDAGGDGEALVLDEEAGHSGADL